MSDNDKVIHFDFELSQALNVLDKAFDEVARRVRRCRAAGLGDDDYDQELADATVKYMTATRNFIRLAAARGIDCGPSARWFTTRGEED
jgi:hypothetical protein